MNRRLPLVLIALLSTSLSLSAPVAMAQERPPAPPAPGAAPPPPPPGDHHGGPRPRFSPADRAAFFEAHLAGLHAGLQLTPEQEKLWPPVADAIRAGAKAAEERAEKNRGDRPANAIAWLRRLSANDTARGETLKAVADAAEPLYKSLTEDQKRRLPFLLHGIRPHGGFGPGARFAGPGAGHGPQGPEGGPQGEHEDDEGEQE